VVGDLGQHDYPQGTRSPAERLRGARRGRRYMALDVQFRGTWLPC
jgi:hypothetical protein